MILSVHCSLLLHFVQELSAILFSKTFSFFLIFYYKYTAVLTHCENLNVLTQRVHLALAILSSFSLLAFLSCVFCSMDVGLNIK